MAIADLADLDRIAKHTRPLPNGCLEWTGCVQQHSKHPELGGYPKAHIGGKTVYVHRWMLSKMLGRDLLPGCEADHTCMHRRCIHPLHLQEATHQENTRLIFTRRAVQS